MAKRKVTNFKNGLEVDAQLIVPRLSAAPTTELTVGEIYYNTTTDKFQIYTDGGWGNLGGTASSSMDTAYNGGSSITVDTAGITLTSSLTTAALLIVADSVTTGNVVDINADGVTSGTILHLDSTAATFTGEFIDCFDGAASAFSVGLYGATIIAGNAATDVLTITAGNEVITAGNLTLTLGDFTMTAGNQVITAGNLTLTLGDFTVTNGTALFDGGTVIIDMDAAEAFLIRTNGDAADVLTVDTTGDAGDTTLLLTPENTTGVGMHIDGSTITTGDALKVTVVANTMTAAGAAISVVADGTEVFAVRDDGSVYSKATAEGTTALQLATGDLVITDGDLTISGGEVAFTSNANAAGVVIANNTITTANQLVGVSSTSITTGALMTLNANCATHSGEVLELISATPAADTATGMSVTMASVTTGAATGIHVVMAEATTTAKGIAVTMDKVTTGDMLYLDAGGSTLTAGSGFYINCVDDNVSDFTVSNYGATTITGQAAGTAALTLSLGDLVITDTDTTTITSVNGVGNTVEIISGGAVGADKGTLVIDQAGTLNATGALLRLEADGVTATNSPYAMQVNAAGVDVGFCKVDSDGATDSVMHIHGGGAIADNQALLELTIDGVPANAGSNMLRVDGSGGTNTAKPVLVEIFDDSVATCLSLSSAPTANDVALFTGTGAITNGYAVLHVTSSGALATGGNTLKVSTTGTPASGAIYAEYDFTGITDTNENIGFKIDAGGKKVIGLHVDADPIANSAVYLTSGAALAADKATLEVVSVPTTNNGDSAVIRVEQTHTAGGSNIIHMVQLDIDKPFFGFETTIGTGNAVEAAAAKSLTTTHFVKVDLEGVGELFFPIGTIAE